MIEILLFILLFVAPFIVLFRRVAHLSKRLSHMEQYLQDKTGTITAPQVHEVKQEESPESETDATVTKTEKVVCKHSPSKPDALGAFFTWLKADWLMKLGAFLIILGIAWFVTYAFAENWIGPMGRIGLGLLFGASVLAVGRYRMARFISQGSILMVVGALSIVFTIIAGQNYGFFSQSSALIFMFLTSCTLGIMSIIFSYRPLAYGNIAIGAAAPYLVSSTEPNFSGLMMYLLVLSIGAVWVAGLKGWRGLILASLTTVFVYSLPFLEKASYVHTYAGYKRIAYQNAVALQYADTGLLFCFIFSALFFFVSIWGMRAVKKVHMVDLLTAILIGIYLLSWILVGAAKEWQSLVLVAWTLVFAFGAFAAVRLGAKIQYFFTYLGVGVVFLGVATALELEGEALTIAYILEAATLILVGYKITQKPNLLWVPAVPSVVPLILALGFTSSYYWVREGIFHSGAFVLYTLIAAAAYLASCFHREYMNIRDKSLAVVRNVAITVVLFFSTITVWLISMALFSIEKVSRNVSYYETDSAVMVALFIYTVAALFFYIRSKVDGARWERVVAIVYLVLVLGRLLLVDVWGMDLFFRIITFIVIGALTIGVAWYEKNTKRKEINIANNE